MIRCAFCGSAFHGHFERKQTGVQNLKCEHCKRVFIVVIQKRWWGYQRAVHIR